MPDKIVHQNHERRSFFVRFLAATVGIVCGLAPLVAGLAFLAGPLRRKENQQSAGGDGFLPLKLSPDALPDDGSPVAMNIMADKQDAWNLYPDQPIGSVWLRKDPQGNVVAFNTTCPHLGCYVDYRVSQRDFYCPCHASRFNLEGQRQNQIPPRNMDLLAVEVRDGTVWVKFQKFRGATPEKLPV